MNTTRRGVLGVAGLALGSLGATGLRPGGSAALAAGSRAQAAWRIAGLFARQDAAAAIGAACPRGRMREDGCTGEGLAEPLAAVLRAMRLTGATISQLDDAALRDRLHARIRQDFIDGDMVNATGWMLSRTEAAACMVVAELRVQPAGKEIG